MMYARKPTRNVQPSSARRESAVEEPTMGSGVAYRDRAKECLRIAQTELDTALKAKWTKIAAEWVVVAERIEADTRPAPSATKIA